MAVIIELNDCEIRVASGSRIVLRTPGYAVVKDDRLEIGDDAVKMARLHPRGTYNRYWHNLNQDALPLASAHARHHADLAYAHLLAMYEQAGKPKEVIFAVPGSQSNEQLSLLLGIVAACPFTTVGLVDSAVASAAATTGPGRYLHMDIHLHHTVYTQLDVGEEVTRGSVETVADGGLSTIHDAVAALIADVFIEHCRFDPLRHAETEQLLYDRIPQCLQTLSTKTETQIEIKFQRTRHEVKLSRADLLDKLVSHYAGALARLAADRIPILSDRVAALPGFINEAPRAAVLEAESVFQGCELHHQTIRSKPPNLNFVTCLPAPVQPKITVPATAAAASAITPAHPVTHLLSGHVAHALGARPIYFSTRGEIVPAGHPAIAGSIVLNNHAAIFMPSGTDTLHVNGIPVTGPRQLLAGDELGFVDADKVYTLIGVVNRHGA